MVEVLGSFILYNSILYDAIEFVKNGINDMVLYEEFVWFMCKLVSIPTV